MSMNKVFAILLTLIFVAVARAQIRVVNYNVAALQGDHESLKQVLTLTSKDNSHGKALPVSIFLFQEVPESKVKPLHELLGAKYSKGTFTDQNESNRAGAQAMFYDSTQLIEVVASHKDIYTGAGRYADRWQLKGVGKNKGISLWVYSAHLKASKGSKNKDKRLTGVKAILEDVATLPKGSNVLVVGDMNFYTNQEPAYQALISVLIDPLGTSEWTGKDDAVKHTQSPRKVRKGGLIHGGLDDRFDFQLMSESLQDKVGLDYIAGSYHAVGNDGRHFDVAINDEGSAYFQGDRSRSKELVDAIHEASDHIPVMADYEIIKAKQQKPVKNTESPPER